MKNTKITIEGFEDEPIIAENIDQMVVLVRYKDDKGTQFVSSCNIGFLGYSCARLFSEFQDAIKATMES